MITCANCSREALYTYQVSDAYLIHYCQNHLPKFLVNKKNAGLLPLISPAPVVEAVVEEPVVEETVKASKKKAVSEETVVEDTPTE